MAYYRIEVVIQTDGEPETKNMDFDERGTALDVWDEVVDAILPGDTAKLIDMDGGRVMSEYRPVDRTEW